MCALNESWLSRTTPRSLAVGTDVTRVLSTDIERSCNALGEEDVAGKKRSSVLSGFSWSGVLTFTVRDRHDIGLWQFAPPHGWQWGRENNIYSNDC